MAISKSQPQNVDPMKASSWEYEQLQEYITSTYGSTNRGIGKPVIQHALCVKMHGEGGLEL